jgi:hypothetical protein
MNKISKYMSVVFVTLLFAFTMTSNVFASSTVNTPTAKLINAKTVDAGDETVLNDIVLTETSAFGFQATGGGKITIKIPSNLKLSANSNGSNLTNPDSTTGTITRSTAILGTEASPHKLYLKPAAAATGVIFLYHSASGTSGSENGILTVYQKGVGGATSAYIYGTGGVTYGTAKSFVAQYGVYTTYTSAGLTATVPQVGQIYFDDTTNEIVISLSALAQSDASFLESLTLENLNVIPAAAVTVEEDSNITIADGDPDGLDLFGVDNHTVKVATLAIQAATVSGASSGTANAPPTIPAGKVAGQACGQLKITLVGDANANDNVITVALDNGAKFHTGSVNAAASNTLASSAPEAIMVAGTNWNVWAATYAGESLTVNASGELVITLGSGDISDTETIVIPRSTTGAIIDTLGVTTAGDITATVSATGTNLADISGTAVVADAQLAGSTVAFVDDTTAGLTTLYTGRTYEAIGATEIVRLAEDAPASLLAGGTLNLALNMGAKFQSGSTFVIAKADPGTSALLFPTPVSVGTTSVDNVTTTLTTPSTAILGGADFTNFDFDLSAATPGSLQVTFSGTAGAAGVATIATIMDATVTTGGDAIATSPNATSVTVPDITITENEAGALAAGYIGFLFPDAFVLDASQAGATITVTGGPTGGVAAAVTMDTTVAGALNVAYIQILTPSAAADGLYTIVISGLTGTTGANASGSLSCTVGGNGTTNKYVAATFGSNFGAKPTTATVAFANVVSATVPFADTPVVSGTAITQTFIPAGNDLGLVGDVYVFTSGQFWTGSAWTATETAYQSGSPLAEMSVNYDVAGLATDTLVYIGYGKGFTGTYATMNTSATFVLAYTVPAAAPVLIGEDAGETQATADVTADTALYLNITNDDGVAYADIAEEWLVFGVLYNGVDQGVWFYDGTDVIALAADTVLADVTYAFDHSVDYFNVIDVNLANDLGMAAGDTFWYAYVYAETAGDIDDATSYVIENIVWVTGE